jgi:hypothetical protein
MPLYEPRPAVPTARAPAVRWLIAALGLLPVVTQAGPAPAPFAPAEAGRSLYAPVSPDRTGIRFSARLDPANRVPYRENGGGVAVADIDADGRGDVYFVSPTGDNRLYRRTGPWQFEDITAKAGVAAAEGLKTGAVFADFDNDGRPDLYVCRFDGPNQLFMNRGGGEFTEEAGPRGVTANAPCTMAYPCDYDRDGDVDLFVATHRRSPAIDADTEVVAMDGTGSVFEAGVPDLLFRNDGTGKFIEVSARAGLRGSRWNSVTAIWCDANADLWPDLVVGNAMNAPDQFFLNQGDGTFAETTASLFPSLTFQTGGLDVADFNGDGWQDLVASDTAPESQKERWLAEPSLPQLRWMWKDSLPPQKGHNALYLNTGAGRFLEAAFFAGVAGTGSTRPVRAVDLDLDGRDDLLFVGQAGAARRTLGSLRAFRNEGGGRFEPLTGAPDLGIPSGINAVALSDLDDDGDRDLICNRFDGVPCLFRNQSVAVGRFGFDLVGTQSNRDGLGAALELRTGNRTLHAWVTPARGYLSAELGPVLLASGTSDARASIRIRWPSGAVQEIPDLEPGQRYRIQEPAEPANPGPAGRLHARLARGTRFREASAETGLTHLHRNAAPPEPRSQPLLPTPLSRLGPGLAIADADGDGRMDIAVGGGELHDAALFLQGAEGRFQRSAQTALALDSQANDAGMAWLDRDGDGDLDLIVGSGGLPASSAPLRSRLYVNDGNGAVESAPPGTVMAEPAATSVVAAADFDRDGDLDVFTGTRSAPRRYPESTPSRLLINQNGTFEDTTPLAAPDLDRAGLVTGALWTDFNADGHADLVVASEWGPIRFYRNARGTLVEETETRLPGQSHGRWTCLAAGDFNNDGAIDLIAGNRGLNLPENEGGRVEVALWAGTWTGRPARLDLLPGRRESGRWVPAVPLGLLRAALPGLAALDREVAALANSDLETLLQGSDLRTTHRLEAPESRSLLLLNDGTGHFRSAPLPADAQLAPATALAVEDFDADGNLDLLIGQNLETPFPTQEPADNNGVCLLLRGNGDGSFDALPAPASGVLCPAPIRAAALIDLQQDGWPDVILSVESGPLIVLRNTGAGNRTSAPQRILLDGPPGNRDAIGARILIHTRKRKTLAREIRAGDGGIAQSEPSVGIDPGPADAVEQLEIFWPDGTHTKHRPPFPRPPERLSRSSGFPIPTGGATPP